MEKFYHKSSGIITYNPYRADMKRRTEWWCVVNTDREITKYYRWWLQKEKHIILQQPAFDSHVSVIRGEQPRADKAHLWKKYHGKKIEFMYEHGNIQSTHDKNNGGMFYWLIVECPFLHQIREEFNFPIGWKLHLTIGRTYY